MWARIDIGCDMEYQVYFSASADQDIDEIIDFIAKDSSKNALGFIDRLEERVRALLSTAPFSGRLLSDYRYFEFDNYVVVYDLDRHKRCVYILLVSESHRDWRKLVSRRL